MDKSRTSTIFVCQQCGKESLKWLGRCPNCQQWNTFAEQRVTASLTPLQTPSSPPQELSRIVVETADRFPLPLAEFNRVLGGGLVPGSLVLIAGEPGIGKSTLLLQVAALVAQTRGKVVYVSGEETLRQIKLRADRLGVKGENLYLLAETDLEVILDQIERLRPSLAIIDSIQTVSLVGLDTSPGSVTQVRECTAKLMQRAKLSMVPIFISGHVTKDGAIAGPRVLEHIVDVVLYLEGETFSAYRLLRGVKNRFGSTNEIGVFEMKEQGLIEVDNPSKAFLSQPGEAVGSAVVPTLEGSRPLLVEIQALTNPTIFGLPRRTANGVDFGRLLIISAVLTKRVGLKLGNQDIIVNVTGGLKIGEPAADLGIALAIASSLRDLAVDSRLVAVGEVGLSGELRAVSQLDRRVAEAARLGFKRCLVPRASLKINPGKIELIPVSTLREAVSVALVRGKSGNKTIEE